MNNPTNPMNAQLKIIAAELIELSLQLQKFTVLEIFIKNSH